MIPFSKTLPRLALALGATWLLAGCSSVRLQSRTNPEAPVITPLRSIVVVVVDNNRDVRAACENRFVKFLNARQTQASASYTQFALDDLKLSREEIREKLKAWNAEAVILTRLAARDTFTTGGNWSGGLASPSITWFDVDQLRLSVYGSGPEIRTSILLESRLYRLEDGALVWTALTRTTVGETTDRLERVNVAIGKLVDQLARNQMIP